MTKTKEEYKKQGKRNRRMGADFERRTRKDLEEKGFICSKWQNNVEIVKSPNEKGEQLIVPEECKCIPAKPSRFQLHGTGFPDFIAYRMMWNDGVNEDLGLKKGTPMQIYVEGTNEKENIYRMFFVECKVNGTLSKLEKEKAQWYLKNNYCSKFLVAYKTKEKNKVKVNYKEVEIK